MELSLKSGLGVLSVQIRGWKRCVDSLPTIVTLQLELPSARAIPMFVASFGLLGLVFGSWALNMLRHREWLPILEQVLDWLLAPRLDFSNIDLTGWPRATVAAMGILLIGTLTAHVLLPRENDLWLKRLLALVSGLGVVGTIVIVLAVVSELSFIGLNFLLLAMAVALLHLHRRPSGESSNRHGIWDQLRGAFGIWHPRKFTLSDGRWLLAFVSLVFLVAMLYHALSVPELDWDAMIYHATMAKIMFRNEGIPLIAGPSIGLQLSANYPPLFSALGAYFYVEIGRVNDSFLRLISPIAAVLTALVVHKIGSLLVDSRLGTLSSILLLMTPLYFSQSLPAVNYSLATFFLSAALLFLLVAVRKGAGSFWIIFGVSYGFALLTSYHALFYLLPIVLSFLIVSAHQTRSSPHLLGGFGLALLVASIIGSVWFLRNAILLGNPVYPFGYGLLPGKYLDSTMLELTVSGIRQDSILFFFGTPTPTLDQFLANIFVNRSHFPALSILSVVGFGLVLCRPDRAVWAPVLLFTLIPLTIISSTKANIFPRYFVLILPPLAILTALVFWNILHWARRSGVSVGIGVSRMYRPLASHSVSLEAVSASLVGAFVALNLVFPGSLALVGGKAYREETWSVPPPGYDLLKFLRPYSDEWDVLLAWYGEDAKAWQWLGERIQTTRRVGTFENRIYYLADGHNEYIYYLDGWEAKALYGMESPAQIVRTLQAARVHYILDPAWIRHWEMYHSLPLNRYLGWPAYFPIVFSTSSGNIYHVGKLDDPITSNSCVAVSLSPTGWGEPELIGGRLARPLAKGDISARVILAREAPVVLEITYLDRGSGQVALNLLASDGSWTHNFKGIQLGNTDEWRTTVFVIDLPNIGNLVQLGIHSPENDFIVSKILAAPIYATTQ